MKGTNGTMLKWLRGCVLAAMLLCTVCGRASQQPRQYDEWEKKPSQELLAMGDAFLNKEQSPDDALVCYSIVANRYKGSRNEAAREQAVRAMVGKWTVYYFHYNDHAHAYESLDQAREVNDRLQRKMPEVYLSFGAMYQTFFAFMHDTGIGLQAVDYFLQAYDAARQRGDNQLMDRAFSNLVNISYGVGDSHVADSLWTSYRQLPVKGSVQRNIARLLYLGTLAKRRKDYAAAEGYFNQLISIIPVDSEHVRALFNAMSNKAEALGNQGRQDETWRVMDEMERLTYRYDLRDMRMVVYGMQAEYSRELGDSQRYREYYDRHIQLKDTLLSYQQVESIGKLQFSNEVSKLDAKMVEMSHRSQIQQLLWMSFAALSLVAVAFLLVVFHKNRRLRSSYASLYNKNRELMQHEKEARQQRAKYQNSHLQEDDKSALLVKIDRAMEQVDEICSPDFSMERLAELTGSNYKHLSQVINEKYECNFNVFVNRYRIELACERLSDVETYGAYTIEAISESVGFKSRSSFVASFKRFTGLTPSEYQRRAREEESCLKS